MTGQHWALSFRSDYLVYVRVRSWSLFLRQPRGDRVCNAAKGRAR